MRIWNKEFYLDQQKLILKQKITSELDQSDKVIQIDLSSLVQARFEGDAGYLVLASKEKPLILLLDEVSKEDRFFLQALVDHNQKQPVALPKTPVKECPLTAEEIVELMEIKHSELATMFWGAGLVMLLLLIPGFARFVKYLQTMWQFSNATYAIIALSIIILGLGISALLSTRLAKICLRLGW